MNRFQLSRSKFNPENDARALKEAGCNEEAIIDIITKRSNEQRQEIFQKFKTMYRKDLISELICTLNGNAEDVIIALMMPRAQYYAVQLRNALFSTEMKLKVIIEILVAVNDLEKMEIEEAYRNFYGNIFEDQKEEEKKDTSERKDKRIPPKEDTLGNDLKRASTSTWVNNLLISLLRSRRRSRASARQQIRDRVSFLQAGLMYDDINSLSYVLFQHDRHDLSRILEQFELEEGQPLLEYARCETDLSDIEIDVLSSIMECLRNPSLYITKCLFDSMIGSDTDNTTLIRIVATKSENRLSMIKDCFRGKSRETLSSAIRNRTSGSLQKFLLAVVENVRH